MLFQSIQPKHLQAAKCLIKLVWLEFLGNDPSEDVRKYPDTRLTDLDDVNAHYFFNQGTFLVVLDGEEVVGTGAIRRITDDACELKHLFLSYPYRNKGIGLELTQRLLSFARNSRYKELRLGTNKKFVAAQRLYRSLGFKDDPDRHDPNGRTIYMKMLL